VARRLQGLHSPEPQAVTFVELFFDLVFVFAVTQVTALAARHLDAPGVARSVIIFWLVWWAWTQFTWTLSPADTRHKAVQALTLAITATAFVMAASIPDAFESEGLWFAVPYAITRAMGLWLQVRVDQERADDEGISMSWIWVSGLGLLVVLAGGLVHDPARTWVWLAAIGVDLVAAGLSSRDAVWELDVEHFSERHGLFVIIALGESLIVAGSSVAAEERTAALIWAAGGTLLVTCLLWWTYFGQLKEDMEAAFHGCAPEKVGPTARDAYSLGHFPLIGGIIAFAIAVKDLMHHPDEPGSAQVIASLAVGVALFVGASAFACWRTTGRLLRTRLIVLALTVVGVVAVSGLDPAWPLGVVALGLLVIVVVERSGPDRDAFDDSLPIAD
jgi:low temperature requirement protein LtrA